MLQLALTTLKGGVILTSFYTIQMDLLENEDYLGNNLGTKPFISLY
jgi:hypothetical protein